MLFSKPSAKTPIAENMLIKNIRERKLLRSRLDPIGTLAANSFPKVLSILGKINEYSLFRLAFYALGESFITRFSQ